MNYSKLKKEHHDFERWSATIKIDGKRVYPSPDYQLHELHIELSDEMTCGCANLSFDKLKKITTLIAAVQTGASIQICLGYQGVEECVFIGYLQEVSLKGNDEDSLKEVHIYAQDVKGLMMLRKHSHMQTKKKRSAWLQEILQDSFYQEYIKKVQLTSLPSALDDVLMIDGKSDYDVIVEICEDCFYSCYMSKGVFYVTPRKEALTTKIVMDRWDDIEMIEQKTSLRNQVGKLTVFNCDGFQNKQKVQTTYTIHNMPQSDKMRGILANTEGLWIDDGFHSMDGMNAALKGIAREVENSYGRITGRGAMLPELQCGAAMEIASFCDGRKKEGVLCRVEHHIDEDGAISEWEAVLTKG